MEGLVAEDITAKNYLVYDPGHGPDNQQHKPRRLNVPPALIGPLRMSVPPDGIDPGALVVTSSARHCGIIAGDRAGPLGPPPGLFRAGLMPDIAPAIEELFGNQTWRRAYRTACGRCSPVI